MYHEVAACHAAGYKYFEDWQDLDASQQAFLIAHYMTKIMLENNQRDAEARDMQRKTAAAKGKT